MKSVMMNTNLNNFGKTYFTDMFNNDALTLGTGLVPEHKADYAIKERNCSRLWCKTG